MRFMVRQRILLFVHERLGGDHLKNDPSTVAVSPISPCALANASVCSQTFRCFECSTLKRGLGSRYDFAQLGDAIRAAHPEQAVC